MRGIILAAGYGTRLGKLTKSIPKPMLEVGGKPVLEHIANYLNKYGVYEIIVNLHYLPEKIMNYFGTRFVYSYEPKLLGEEGTIVSLARWIEKDYCVVVNGDTLTNLDLNEMFRMSQGRNIKFMEGETYAGVRIITPLYGLGDKKSSSYQNKNFWWVDIGTKEGLERAKEIIRLSGGLYVQKDAD